MALTTDFDILVSHKGKDEGRKEKITEMGIIQSSMQMDAPVTKEETVYTDDSEDMVSQEIIGGADEATSIYLESSGDSGSSETE